MDENTEELSRFCWKSVLVTFVKVAINFGIFTKNKFNSQYVTHVHMERNKENILSLKSKNMRRSCGMMVYKG